MRFTDPALNNEWYDEDNLRAYQFKSLGKNLKVHRSVVFMKPANVSIGDNVTIMPYCVFGTGKTVIPSDGTIPSFSDFPGEPEETPVDAEKRIKELEAQLKAKEDYEQAKIDAEKLRHVRG